MGDRVLLWIDLDKLQDHFAESGEPMSVEAIETGLRQMGFKRADDGWIVEALSLKAPNRTEYRIVRRL